jgi:hypothetical protein
VVDLDLSWQGTAVRLGIEDGAHKTWADAVNGGDELLRAALPVPGGFRALLGPADGTAGDGLTVLARATESFERVVADVPYGPWLARALNRASAGVLVVAPSLEGARRTRTVLIEHPTTSWAVVLNRTGHGGQITKGRFANLIGRSVTVELPCTPVLRDSEDEGRLCSRRWTRWARRVETLARTLDKR